MASIQRSFSFSTSTEKTAKVDRLQRGEGEQQTSDAAATKLGGGSDRRSNGQRGSTANSTDYGARPMQPVELTCRPASPHLMASWMTLSCGAVKGPPCEK